MKSKSVFLKRLPKQILQYAILLFGAFCALVPIVSCVTTAFKTDEEYRTTSVMTLPESWLNFENFKVAWVKAVMGRAFLNSFLILVCVLVGSTMISAMLAYVLNRFQFRGNHLIRNLFMVAADSRHRNTGHSLSDHDRAASGQHPLRLYFPDARHRCHCNLHLSAIFRESPENSG